MSQKSGLKALVMSADVILIEGLHLTGDYAIVVASDNNLSAW
jgi:hypothetical protein